MHQYRLSKCWSVPGAASCSAKGGCCLARRISYENFYELPPNFSIFPICINRRCRPGPLRVSFLKLKRVFGMISWILRHTNSSKKSKLVKNLILSKKLRQLGENKLLSDEQHVEKKKRTKNDCHVRYPWCTINSGGKIVGGTRPNGIFTIDRK